MVYYKGELLQALDIRYTSFLTLLHDHEANVPVISMRRTFNRFPGQDALGLLESGLQARQALECEFRGSTVLCSPISKV